MMPNECASGTLITHHSSLVTPPDRWIECVPNFSEGRDEGVVRAIAEAAHGAGAAVLDMHMDADHNRSVVTIAADPTTIVEAAFRAVARAVELIDLSTHTGAHPRIGAADVVPFVPVSGVSQAECVAAADSLAARLAAELNLPAYLYEWAARREDHRNLAEVRKGHRAALESGEALSPDLGPSRPHPTAGAVAIGARAALVAFNCYLSPPDLTTARRVAARTRERGGGPKGVRALGLWLPEADTAQVSMNITDVEASPPDVVVELVEELARAEGAHVTESELVGLIPLDAVLRAAARALKLPSLDRRQVLELAIQERRAGLELDGFLDALASGSPAPGGGAASALAGALAAALASMVCNLTVGRPRYESVDAEMREALAEAVRLRLHLRELMQADEEAYSALMAQYKLPKETDEEKARRATAIESALKRAADVPLETGIACAGVLRLLTGIASGGNKNAISDAGAAGLIAEAAGRAALLNVRTNASLMKDHDAAASYLERMNSLEREMTDLAAEVLATAVARIG